MNLNLNLFFTGGISLQTWKETGLINRELAIYRRLFSSNIRTRLITYGHPSDQEFKKEIFPLNVITTPWLSTTGNTTRRLFIRHFPSLITADVLKTNQIIGSEIPVNVKKILNKPLITRCGYLHSIFTQEHTSDRNQIEAAIAVEVAAFRNSDRSIVTSELQRQYVIDNYSINPDIISVIPNYVDTDLFSPLNNEDKKWDLIYIGRSDSQKNLINLLKAIQMLRDRGEEKSLLLVGGAGSDPVISDIIHKNHLPVTQIPNLPNEHLPHYLNASRVFILPSLYEGHPKILLEAMSCEIPCIGTPVPGIQEEIISGKTGFLASGIFPDDISSIISYVLDDEKTSSQVGKNAREFIQNNYGLDHISKIESHLIQDVVNSW
ncbi:glycosyltransferase family 4 protein [uncultured Methanospirillum sp.]|uniref:glycosyltransferase family 4 protein n=1 Tax=uncultured Methanospirillum sp. TaxID=262503 RepID=UPI0029C6E7F0|nr:glycosyltransferase family 4 protein [uncultured Methanospirillum sp.]